MKRLSNILVVFNLFHDFLFRHQKQFVSWYWRPGFYMTWTMFKFVMFSIAKKSSKQFGIISKNQNWIREKRVTTQCYVTLSKNLISQCSKAKATCFTWQNSQFIRLIYCLSISVWCVRARAENWVNIEVQYLRDQFLCTR